MLPSLEKELRNTIRKLQEEQYSLGSGILMDITGIINRAEYLDKEQKEALLHSIWKDRKESHK
jgi:hypothetical protein